MTTRNFLLALSLASLSFVGYSQPRHAFDPMNPDVHDPVIAYENGRYYLFCTGWGIGEMSSEDLAMWRRESAPLNPIPVWAKAEVPAYRGHTWAPDIIKVGDRWWMYYSCSTFGKNISAIGVASNKTLDRASEDYEWVDHGMVILSVPGYEVIVGESENYSGVGHCSVYEFDGKWIIAAHGYDKRHNGASKLYIRELEWMEGWPVVKE